MEFRSTENKFIVYAYEQFELVVKPICFGTILKQIIFGFKSAQPVHFLQAARRLPVGEFSLTFVQYAVLPRQKTYGQLACHTSLTKKFSVSSLK